MESKRFQSISRFAFDFRVSNFGNGEPRGWFLAYLPGMLREMTAHLLP